MAFRRLSLGAFSSQSIIMTLERSRFRADKSWKLNERGMDIGLITSRRSENESTLLPRGHRILDPKTRQKLSQVGRVCQWQRENLFKGEGDTFPCSDLNSTLHIPDPDLLLPPFTSGLHILIPYPPLPPLTPTLHIPIPCPPLPPLTPVLLILNPYSLLPPLTPRLYILDPYPPLPPHTPGLHIPNPHPPLTPLTPRLHIPNPHPLFPPLTPGLHVPNPHPPLLPLTPWLQIPDPHPPLPPLTPRLYISNPYPPLPSSYSLVPTNSPSSSHEMIILGSKNQAENIRVCMGIFTAALRNKKYNQILNKNTSPYFHSALLVV